MDIIPFDTFSATENWINMYGEIMCAEFDPADSSCIENTKYLREEYCRLNGNQPSLSIIKEDESYHNFDFCNGCGVYYDNRLKDQLREHKDHDCMRLCKICNTMESLVEDNNDHNICYSILYNRTSVTIDKIKKDDFRTRDLLLILESRLKNLSSLQAICRRKTLEKQIPFLLPEIILKTSTTKLIETFISYNYQ